MSESEPRTLDELLVEASRRLARQATHPGESTIVAYLTGTANELQIQEVREAVIHSHEFREELVELKRTMDELAAPALAERFDREDVGVAPSYPSALTTKQVAEMPASVPSPERSSPVDWFRGLMRTPAFAYGLLVALMAYPTYRYFVPGDESSFARRVTPVMESVSLLLREDPRGVLRGDTDRPRLPRLEIDPEQSLVRLDLEVPRASHASSWHTTLSDEQREVWRSETPRPVRVVDEDRVVTLELDPRVLDAGVVTVVLEEGDASAEPRRAVYRFVLVKET